MNWNAFVLDSDSWSLLFRQSIQITVLIVVVGLITRFCLANRPRLAHTLWALVLLKCLTPPIFALPVSPFSWGNQFTKASSQTSATEQADRVESASQEERAVNSAGQELATDTRGPIDADSIVMPSPTRDSAVEPTAATNVPTPISTPMPTPSKKSYSSFAVGIWLLGSVVALFLVSIRLIRFLRDVYRDRIEPRDRTIQLLRETVADMQLSGNRVTRVRIQVVDSLIGPAVVGIWRPKILLPRVLELESSRTELRMLLAHELVHIQRSDLCWALIQTLASCLWWFHPLMWNLQRTFNRVTELSCDEEVIERLKCRPSEYARALLMVLERKHQLRVAPALPGVRPVEITSRRMERVMKFDGTKNATRPWMTALCWLVGVVLVLPGAQWATAQEDSAHNPQEIKPTVPVSDAWSRLPRPALAADSVSDLVVHAEPVTVRRYDASKALAKIRREDQASKEQASAILNASLDNVAGQSGRVIVMDDHVVARASDPSHKKIQTELERIATFGFTQQTVISTRICSMSKSLFVQLQIAWELERTEGKQKPLVTATLDRDAMSAAIELIQNDTSGNILMAPKVTTFNGQKADIETGVQRPFVVRGKANPKYDTAGVTGAWVGRLEFEGMRLSVRPVSEGESTDLEVDLKLSKIKDVNEFTFAVAKDQTMTVQVPDVIEQSACISTSVPKAHTIAIGMPNAESPDQVIVCFVSPESVDESVSGPASTLSASVPYKAPVPIEVTVPFEAIPSKATTPAKTEVAPVAHQSINRMPAQLQPAMTAARHEPSSLATWIMKADGAATSTEVIKRCNELLRPFEAKTRMEGDWQMSIDGDMTTLSGKNLSLSTLDGGPVMRCTSGSLTIAPARSSLTFQSDSDGRWDVSIPDSGIKLRAKRITIGEVESELQAFGEMVDLELTIDNVGEIQGKANKVSLGDYGARLEGDVQLAALGKTLRADRVDFGDDETTTMLLRGGVHVTSGNNQKLTEIRCEGLNLDLSTGEVRLVE